VKPLSIISEGIFEGSKIFGCALVTACLLQLAEIQDICCEFLKRQLDPSNCLGIRAFADTHSCRELLRIADKFTQHNFQEVMESEEFLLLPVGQLVDIISSDELNVRSEEQVFSAVMSWVKYNVSERRQHLAQVSYTYISLVSVFKRNVYF
jgi:kelch-like protein 20